MKPEDKLRRLLHAADPEALSQYPMTDEATRRRIRDVVLGEAEPEQKPVTVHRISRIVNAAAVFLLIAGITGGSIAAIQTLRRNPLPPAGQYSSDPASAAESSTDLPDQLTVYGWMLNAPHYYDRISGRIATGVAGSPERTQLVSFSLDIPALTSHELMQYVTLAVSPDEVLTGAEPTFTGEPSAAQETDFQNGTVTVQDRGNTEQYTLEEAEYTLDAPVDPAEVHDYFSKLHTPGQDALDSSQIPRTACNTPANIVWAEYCIHPYEIAQNLLTDSECWHITARTDYAGRTCLVLDGTVSALSNYSEDQIGSRFTIYVDEQTGCLLYAVIFDANDNPDTWMCTQEIHIEASAQPTEAVTAETEESNIFPDQMTVYDRMLNSQNHFTRVSGQYAEDYGMGFVNVCSFAADLPGMTSNIYLDTVKTVVSAQEIADGAADFGGVTDRLYPVRRLVTTDGKRFEAWEDERMYSPAEEGSELCNPVYPQDEPVDAQTVRDFCMTHNRETDWGSVSRTIPAGAWEIADCLFPQTFAMLYLSDFDTWKVQGTETFAGRTCTVIDGQAGDRMNQLEDPCHEQLAGTHFILYVDEATGCLLCMRVYDDQSNLIDWLAVQDITFDEDAAAPDTDLSGYTLIDHES